MLILPKRFTEQKVETELGSKLSCAVQIRIRKSDGRIVKPFGDHWFKNLITNNGLDFACQGNGIAGYLYNGGNAYCQIGTGTTTPAVTDVKLTIYVKNTTTIAAGCSSSNDTTNGAFTATINFSFSSESSTVTYTEIGIAQTSSTTTGLLTHATFSGVTLNSGDALVPAYTFTESVPSIITPITVSLAAVNGFNVSGTMKVVGLYSTLFGTVSSTGFGGTVPTNQTIHLTSSTGVYLAPALCTGPTSFPSVNTALTETGAVTGSTPPSLAGYTAGTFTRTVNLVFPTGSTGSGFNMIRLLASGTGGAGHGLYLLLTSAQTKGATTLTITVSLTMTRV